MVNQEAGRRRLNLREKKPRRLTPPELRHSLIIKDVIRNPDKVKNVDTPRKPPGAQEKRAWKRSTAITARARRPSSEGS
jgi:hypothetical protein